MYGVEIEVPGLPPAAGNVFRERFNCTMHDDGSLRRPVYSINKHPFIFPDTDIPPDFVHQEREYGAEIVTPPMTYDNMLSFLAFAQHQLAHIPKFSSRGSIHVHVGVENKPWKHVQNLMGWFLHLEAILYRFAAEGGTHRGEERYDGNVNDYRYCRPLSAPICTHFYVGNPTTLVQPIIDTKALLAAKTASEFLAAWGRLDYFQPERKYVPHRLHGINLLTVLQHGAVEWRLFDGYYRDLIAFFKIVCRVHELAESQPYPKLVHGLGTNAATNEYARSLFVETESQHRLTEKKFSKLWGTRFPSAVFDAELLHHYHTFSLHTIKSQGVQTARLNHGADNGGETVTLYRSRG
jgi:hypothetical protein